ncbi:MAG: sigma-70 family RNA polymerase sigma factor [Clostridiaceae bacterium]|jgi:RNA polymerase sporulation-specific sigma factor|nr:sigma-70 family RNA polymerase sigma factor [Clostridiaceae bacterium]
MSDSQKAPEKDLLQERDLKLWLLSQADDEDAISELLRLYKGLVRSVAQPFFLQGGEKDDLLQEGMIGLLQAIQQYDPGQNTAFRTFARLVIQRSMLDAVRSASRKSHDPLNRSISLETEISDAESDSQIVLADMLEDDSPAPDQEVISTEQLEAFLAFMQNNLSELEQGVVKGLRLGMSYQEIAVNLGRSTKSVDNAIQRLRSKLRDYGKAEGNEFSQ